MTKSQEIYDEIEKYPHPHVTVDMLIFAVEKLQLKILLIERGLEPFKGKWAIPGGFVRIEESLESAARRELKEEVGMANVYLEQLHSFGEVDRDPRGRVITVAYYALLPTTEVKAKAASDAVALKWFEINKLPGLAFDHRTIIDYALQRLRSKILYSSIAYSLLPKKFTLTEMQQVFETVLDKKLDKRNFRKKILSLDIVKPLKEKVVRGRQRPSQLYQFKKAELVYF